MLFSLLVDHVSSLGPAYIALAKDFPPQMVWYLAVNRRWSLLKRFEFVLLHHVFVSVWITLGFHCSLRSYGRVVNLRLVYEWLMEGLKP